MAISEFKPNHIRVSLSLTFHLCQYLSPRIAGWEGQACPPWKNCDSAGALPWAVCWGPSLGFPSLSPRITDGKGRRAHLEELVIQQLRRRGPSAGVLH